MSPADVAVENIEKVSGISRAPIEYPVMIYGVVLPSGVSEYYAADRLYIRDGVVQFELGSAVTRVPEWASLHSLGAHTPANDPGDAAAENVNALLAGTLTDPNPGTLAARVLAWADERANRHIPVVTMTVGSMDPAPL